MSKWKTLKELPGIKVGTIAEQDQPTGIVIFTNGQSSWRVNHTDLGDCPDFFQRIEEEPKFVDVEIKPGTHHRLEVMLPVFVPCFGGHSEYINALPSIPEFVGFVYKDENEKLLTALPRLYGNCDMWIGQGGDPSTDPGVTDVQLPTHARFRRHK